MVPDGVKHHFFIQVGLVAAIGALLSANAFWHLSDLLGEDLQPLHLRVALILLAQTHKLNAAMDFKGVLKQSLLEWKSQLAVVALCVGPQLKLFALGEGDADEIWVVHKSILSPPVQVRGLVVGTVMHA